MLTLISRLKVKLRSKSSDMWRHTHWSSWPRLVTVSHCMSQRWPIYCRVNNVNHTHPSTHTPTRSHRQMRTSIVCVTFNSKSVGHTPRHIAIQTWTYLNQTRTYLKINRQTGNWYYTYTGGPMPYAFIIICYLALFWFPTPWSVDVRGWQCLIFHYTSVVWKSTIDVKTNEHPPPHTHSPFHSSLSNLFGRYNYIGHL